VLLAGGVEPVLVGQFGDYVRGAPPVTVVSDEGGPEIGSLEEEAPYEVRLQIRVRGDDILSILDVGELARRLVMQVRDSTLEWTSPLTGTVFAYHIHMVRVINRPHWIPTQPAGEMATSNYRVLARLLE
jgi:hypothetical protein